MPYKSTLNRCRAIAAQFDSLSIRDAAALHEIVNAYGFDPFTRRDFDTIQISKLIRGGFLSLTSGASYSHGIDMLCVTYFGDNLDSYNGS